MKQLECDHSRLILTQRKLLNISKGIGHKKTVLIDSKIYVRGFQNERYLYSYIYYIYIRSLFSRLAFSLSFSFFYTLSPFVSLRPNDKTKDSVHKSRAGMYNSNFIEGKIRVGRLFR